METENIRIKREKFSEQFRLAYSPLPELFKIKIQEYML